MLRCLFGLVLLLTFSPLASFAEEPKPNALTPKEIADGWILLFDGETTFGWKIEGEVKVSDGVLVLGGTHASTAAPTTLLPARNLSLEIHFQGAQHPKFVWRNGSATEEIPKNVVPDGKQFIKLAFVEKDLAKSDRRVLERIIVPAGCQVSLRNFKVQMLGLKPLFNGRDLSGWKEFPNRKSKFTVTPEGWLNIKDGPGDLQTEGQWGDFALQLECISNGTHLNSGVFFRCRPDEYQQGYEAQIRNQFTDEPKQEYTLDEYDPETHKLIGKKKEKYQAVDYGTGAIYRRQPARRPVAKDHEWFTMTVIAQGRHLATWINGIQVTDWTDHRPLADNARNGCRLERGPISLQGHDPTTDLSFRNFRIAELPKAVEKN